ncbi:response regulator [Albidovulum sediminicola]|uniref:Response regulator n=1 Tax=Albidovulum sediminicola TaxID=2984331 RepID=A0ABT2Z6W9_9RHOB|nr:response regulator [Defluviimonas sp. WL0075]MCV2866767.1 response regulator [Defluviimonas sp. WL0075]
MTAHILIVEDDRVTRMRLAGYLRSLGYRVTEVEDAESMQGVIDIDPPELLLLDIGLEGKDGLTITREQRAKSRVGIILLTSRDEQVDRIVGLEMGADDYVTKPFDRRELAARIKNLLSRITRIGQDAPAPEAVEDFGPWHFDRIRRRLVSAARIESLSAQEFDLLDILTRNPGITFTRPRLSEVVGRGEFRPGDRTIDVLVGRLRKKIEADPARPDYLLTRTGEGYCFTSPSGT